MKTISPHTLHELTGLTARLTAIVSCLKNPEVRPQLDLEQANLDFEAALLELREIWRQAMNREKLESDSSSNPGRVRIPTPDQAPSSI